jgi:two-component sensor histidine kinase
MANRLAETLNRELQHRVGNMLTVIHGLVIQTAKGSSPETFVASLGGRLQALKKAHELLGRRNLETCTLPELIDEACLPFVDGTNFIKRGPPCQLPAASWVRLVLALHELCTNAFKYGALSNSDGRVEVAWAFSEQPQRIAIEWTEIGGPVVSRPAKKGLGSALLRRQQGIAEVDLVFDPSGVCCTLSIDGAEPIDATPARSSHNSPRNCRRWRSCRSSSHM